MYYIVYAVESGVVDTVFGDFPFLGDVRKFVKLLFACALVRELPD